MHISQFAQFIRILFDVKITVIALGAFIVEYAIEESHTRYFIGQR